MTPILVLIIFKKYNQEIKNNDQIVFKKYSPFLKEFRCENNIKVFAYYPIFYIRRIVFSITAYCLGNFPTAQIAINCAFTLAVIIYFIRIRPFIKNYVNFILIFQEVIIFSVLIIVSFFLSASLRPYETLWAYIVIGCCGLLFIISLLIGISISIKKIILKLREVRNRKYQNQAANENKKSSKEIIQRVFPNSFLRINAPNNSINQPSIISFPRRQTIVKTK